MRKVTVAEWTAALRSGKYEQGRGFLNGPKGHCCLGVLCELAEVPVVETDDQGIKMFEFAGGFKSNWDVPRAASADLVEGLDLATQVVDPRDDSMTFSFKTGLDIILMGMNDEGFWSFGRIADFLDEVDRGIVERLGRE